MITSVTAPTIEKAPFPDMYEIHYVTVYDGNLVDLTDEFLIRAAFDFARQRVTLFIMNKDMKKQVYLTFLHNHLQRATVDMKSFGVCADSTEKAVIKLFNTYLCDFIKELKKGGMIK